MRTYEADEDSTYCEFDNDNQTIIVSADIENIVLIADIVGCGKILSYFRQIMPLGLLGDVIPPFQSNPGIFVTGRFIELFDFPMRDYVHYRCVSEC